MRPKRSILWLLIPVAFALRLAFAASRQVVPDEAFYWVLSRHLSTGYLDHPPMVAYLIKLGTWALGANELGVRFMAASTAFGSLLVVLSLCRRLVGSDRAVLFLSLIWLCSPLFAGLATIMTPDTPAIFFSVCAMTCAIKIVGSALADGDSAQPSASFLPTIPSAKAGPTPRSSTMPWLAFGLFTGLAMLSKYTAVLPAVAVFFALLTCPEGRSQFRKPGVWLAAIAALIVFSPTVYWNATHQWASFKYQLHHGLDAANLVNHSSTGQRLALHLGSLGEYLLGQIAFFTPVFFVFGVVVLFLRWREYRTLSQAHRILVWSTTLPLLFFAFVALKSGSPGEANWPAFAYFPMSLLIVDHVARAWKASDVQWIRIGCAVALAITLPLHSPDLLYRLGWKQNFPRKLNEFYGWREMGRSVGANRGDALVVAGSHQDAAELAFYMPGQPEVWVYNFPGRDGKPNSRPTAFDYFPDRPDLSKVDRLLFFYGDTTDFCRAFGFIPVANYDFRIFLHGRERSRSYVLLQRRSNPADRTYSP